MGIAHIARKKADYLSVKEMKTVKDDISARLDEIEKSLQDAPDIIPRIVLEDWFYFLLDICREQQKRITELERAENFNEWGVK